MQQKKTTLAIAVLAACGGYTATGVAQVTGPSASNVEEVLVFGTQGTRETTTGSRLNLTVLETPATVDIIDGDAIRAASTRASWTRSRAAPGSRTRAIRATAARASRRAASTARAP